MAPAELLVGRDDHVGFDELLHRIVVGGWPKIINSDEHDASDWLADYLAQIAETDVGNMGHRRNPTAKVLGIGRTLAYELIRTDAWPTPVIRLGKLIKIPSHPLLDLIAGKSA